MLRYVSARLAGLLVPALAALALGMGSNLMFVPDANAQHKMTQDDMEVPIDDPKVVELGREKFASAARSVTAAAVRAAKARA